MDAPSISVLALLYPANALVLLSATVVCSLQFFSNLPLHLAVLDGAHHRQAIILRTLARYAMLTKCRGKKRFDDGKT